MLKTHEKFYSENGRRLILIVDDEAVNRELLNLVLKDDYETIFAADGESALAIIREKSEVLSLVILDLLMPGMHGLELIKILKNDQNLKDIPIIVMTADQESEVESLQLGASDFIPKPYPKKEVILTRVVRSIELSEDRDIITSTERDHLTGLYNREYFYRFAEQFDQHHKDNEMDAIVVDIYHFHMINERYGKAYGDEVLRRIGEKLREMVRDAGGIVCRREADTFLVYCPHRDDYKAILENASIGIEGEEASSNRIRLRMGVYAYVDKSIEIERRFDRAKMASDTIRSNYQRSIALYDNQLHESEIYAERLLEDFHRAIKNHEFVVFYQPKFDIRSEIPVLSSAEALVRWQHPEIGLVSPGVFIPLFEDNGMIEELDIYVWRAAAAQIRDWKMRFGITVPVSVNVSRIDMYDPNLIGIFQNILQEYDLSAHELLLEITESAYTQDSAQIINVVNQLRDLGFRIEMDDFGTGYSSLNMISSLPIDALKLDMKFIRDAFRDGRNTRLIEVIVDIADYLNVPVIAEGVETEEQLEALKLLRVDIVQGYYFSKPVPPAEYETFIIASKDHLVDETGKKEERKPHMHVNRTSVSANIVHALTSGFEVIYYVNTENGRYIQFSSQGKYEDLQIERSGKDFFADTQKNIARVIYEEDVERVSLSLQKEALLAQLMGDRSFSLTYRLMLEGRPVFYNLRAVNASTQDEHHIVIGVSNVEEQIQQVNEGTDNTEKNREFVSIAQALSSDFESIYYVNIVTDDYKEFTAPGAYEDLQIERSGTDFFQECQKNIGSFVFEEDQPMIRASLQKDKLLEALREHQTFSVVYRLLIDGEPVFYRMKIVNAEDGDHIVIGVASIENQVVRDHELEISRKNSITYANIAQALAADYFSIYYVNTETDHFIEFSAHDEFNEQGIGKGGEDFFDQTREKILKLVHPDDQEKILTAFTKEKLLTEMDKSGTFTLNYRLMNDGEPQFVSLKVTHMADKNDKHIVIGVNSIDAQVKRQQEYDAVREKTLTYGRVAQALSKDYFSIYLVNLETDEFIEYSSHSDYQDLQIEQNGTDFFEDCRKNILRLVYKDDLDKALAVWDKEKLVPELKDGKTFSSTYRLMISDVPVYINCKVIQLTDEENEKYIVIGVSNVDAQIRRERELNAASEKANRDALTGVKSKHAYNESALKINSEIEYGISSPFAVAVCDVNGLKMVNDTKGHQAGDKLILDAARVICDIFKHSPVYRIGGDEFVAILRGSDYENRQDLIRRMTDWNAKNHNDGGVIIACGCEAWIADQDETLEEVFRRADAAMYLNKDSLKNMSN